MDLSILNDSTAVLDVMKHNQLVQYKVNQHSYENLHFYYISDIHLDYHIAKECDLEEFYKGNKQERAKVISKIKSIIDYFYDDIDGTYVNDIAPHYQRTILIGGDIANNIKLVEVFFEILRENSSAPIFYVLGNHELSQFETYQKAIDAYTEMTESLDIVLLQNVGIYHYFTDRTHTTPKCAIFGGIGFSKYNEEYNVNNLCYSVDLKGNRALECQLADETLREYKRCLSIAEKANIPLIVLTHCPTKDWCPIENISDKCIYFYGHNHQNYYSNTDKRVIIADNQIGYDGKIRLKSFVCGNVANPYADYEDGFYKTTIDNYLHFYDYIGEHIQSHTRIDNSLSKTTRDLYVLKKYGYYCFLITTEKGTQICQGGNTKFISKNNDITYFYNYFDKMLITFLNAMLPYRKVQEQISKEVQSLGFDGTIHGCIVDVDFTHHIMINPYDGKMTFYYSPMFGQVKEYRSFKSMLPHAYNRHYFKTQQVKELYSDLIMKNAIICQKKTEIQELKQDLITIDIKNSLYSTSRKLNQIQRLFSGNVLRDWNDELIQSYIE